MAENFGDIRSIKNKRGGFMGGVKEVNSAPIPQQKPAPVPTPTPTQGTPISKSPETAPVVAPVADKDKTTLKTGFVVGYTDDGIVKLQPFGGLSELELVGLIEYSKTKSGDMLNKIARTSVGDIGSLKKGVTILAESIKTLLTHDQDTQAAS